jgi:hypothetical protein
MERNRLVNAHAMPRAASRGAIASKHTATRSSVIARRDAVTFGTRLRFGLTLVAVTLACAFATMALWSVVAKPASIPKVQPEQSAASAEAESPAATPFPKPVKTLRFTPSGN